MSQLAGVNIHSSVGMFTFYDIFYCTSCIMLFVHCEP